MADNQFDKRAKKKSNPNMPATEKSSSKHLPMAINNKPESAVRWVIGTET